MSINFKKYYSYFISMRSILVLVFLFSTVLNTYANAQPELLQNRKIDSLKSIISTSKDDVAIVKSLLAWDNMIYNKDTKLDLELNLKIEEICKRNLKKKLGKEKLKFYKKTYASCLNNIGGNYLSHGHYAKAIEYQMHSLSMYEEIGDLNGTSNTLNNIGILYKDQGKFEEAINYLEKSIKISLKLNDTLGTAQSYGNIGVAYQLKKDFPLALEYFYKCLRLIEPFGQKLLTGMTYLNIGVVYHDIKDNSNALDYYKKALKIFEEINYTEGIASVYTNIGTIYTELGDYRIGIDFNLKALKIGKELDALLVVKESSYSLYLAYKAQGNYREALAMKMLNVATGDSITNEESQREITRQEFKYKYEKKALADSVRAVQEKKVASIQLEQEQAQRYILYIGLFITFVFAIFMVNRFVKIKNQKRIIEEQKRIVEDQKHLVDIKQKEVLDSLHYAKRIQQALLPSKKYLEKYLGKK
jgi:tetratricopeptide (TPR) repeat protein